MRWSQREIKCLLCFFVYEHDDLRGTRVAWWIVFSMNCTVTQSIDSSMTEHILASLCIRWYLLDLGTDGLLYTILQWLSIIMNLVGTSCCHHSIPVLRTWWSAGEICVHPQWQHWIPSDRYRRDSQAGSVCKETLKAVVALSIKDIRAQMERKILLH